jgi:hypothetical protein
MKLTQIALAGLVAISALAAGTAAFAAKAYAVHITYYSDATKTVVVGELESYCVGNKTELSGRTTAYFRQDNISCGGAGPGRPGDPSDP